MPTTNKTNARRIAVARNLGNKCQVCRHEQRWQVEILRAAGASFESLAQKFGVDKDAIWRHWTKHVSAEMKAGYLAGPVQLQELAAKAADTGVSVLDHLHAVRCVLMGHMASMTEAGDGRGAAYVAGRLTSTLETIAKISGELGDLARSTTFNIHQNNTVNVAASPEYLGLRTAVLQALRKHPEARADVLAAVHRIEPQAVPAPAAAAGNGLLIDVTPVVEVAHG
jgi:hypothetical protein